MFYETYGRRKATRGKDCSRYVQRFVHSSLFHILLSSFHNATIYNAKVRVCKTRLANLRDDYEAAKSNVERNSLGLNSDIESGGRNSRGRSSGSKERLLSNTDALQSQSETLANARSIMAETEGVAMEITEELGRHRETITSAHGRVRQVTGMTNRARRIVQSMGRREVQQKLILYGVGGTVAVVFLFLVYSMFR
jgi:vesicle transport through interaction with t-SNAREs protein 1